jgi:hypothetical protein
MPVCESCCDVGLNEMSGGRDTRERRGRFHRNFDGICLPRACYGCGGLRPAFCETFADVRTFVFWIAVSMTANRRWRQARERLQDRLVGGWRSRESSVSITSKQ